MARRVAFEVSDSDDGPSDSEYDSDEWGKFDSFVLAIMFSCKQPYVTILANNLTADTRPV